MLVKQCYKILPCCICFMLVEADKWMRLHWKSMVSIIFLVMIQLLPQVVQKLNTLIAPAWQG